MLLRLVLCLGLVLLVAHSDLFGYDNVFSKANGFDAIVEIASVEKFQEEIEATPSQIDALRQITRSDKVNTVFALAMRQGNERFAAKDALDAFFRAEIRRILTKEQLEARRVAFLRRTFPTPLTIIDSQSFSQFGFSKPEFDTILLAVAPKRSRLTGELDKMRTDVVGRFIGELTPKSQERFHTYFGGRYSSNGQSAKGWSEIGFDVLPEARATQLLLRASVLILPKELALSDAQRKQIDKLEQRYLIESAKAPGKSSDEHIDNELKKILAPQQIIALAQVIHGDVLTSDLTTLVRPEVIACLELSDEFVEKWREELQMKQSEVNDRRVALEWDALQAGLGVLPKEKRARLTDLLMGVWEVAQEH